MFTRDPATATIGNEILPFETSELTDFFRKKAEVELNDTPERRAQGLNEIKELIKNETSMQDMNFTNDYLLQFLRAKKYNVDKAFSQLKAAMKFKKCHPELFSNFCFENIVIGMTDKVNAMLPYRCQDGCALFLADVENWNLETFPVEEVKRMWIICILQSLRNTMTQVNGFKAIFNVQNSALKCVQHITPSILYLIVHCTQDLVPARYKGVHVINNSVIFKTIWMIVKPLLPEKMKKRIFFHSSYETLLDHFPKEILPVKYGGTLENYDMSDWLRKMMQPEELLLMFGQRHPDMNTAT